MSRKTPAGRRVVAKNRRARFDYDINDRIEAGISLLGSEVKSLRGGRVTLQEAFVQLDGQEAWLENLHIPPYAWANTQNHEPRRRRKLLLKRAEISRLIGKVAEKGMTLVPMEMYFEGPWVKVEIGLGKGRKSHDKRRAIREREEKRDAQRAIRGED